MYGRLYNWFAVNDPRNIAPEGWHVASDGEWSVLSGYLGGNAVAGGKLKEAGFIHWQDPNSDATNETGFSALPGGHREYGGNFTDIGMGGGWWCSTEENYNDASIRYMDHGAADTWRYVEAKQLLLKMATVGKLNRGMTEQLQSIPGADIFLKGYQRQTG